VAGFAPLYGADSVATRGAGVASRGEKFNRAKVAE